MSGPHGIAWERIQASPEEQVVRRLPVPGGWLYQVEESVGTRCSLAFVPEAPTRLPSPAVDACATNQLCIIEGGEPVAKSEEFWRGFVRGLTDLSANLLNKARVHDGGLVSGGLIREVVDELGYRPTAWLTSSRGSGVDRADGG